MFLLARCFGVIADYEQLNQKYLAFVSTVLYSDTSIDFAKVLGIKTKIDSLSEYPCIKCNINKSGEKIYHLPFDQQYDKCQIKNKGEFFAMTVAEAEVAGFRRAMRWSGNNSKNN